MAKKNTKPQPRSSLKRSPKRTTKAVAILPKNYPALLAALKERIRAAQLRDAITVNHELVTLYWHIGKEVLQR